MAMDASGNVGIEWFSSKAILGAILTLLAGVVSIILFKMEASARRRKLSEEEVKRGETSEKEALKVARKRAKEVNDSIVSQEKARKETDF